MHFKTAIAAALLIAAGVSTSFAGDLATPAGEPVLTVTGAGRPHQ